MSGTMCMRLKNSLGEKSVNKGFLNKMRSSRSCLNVELRQRKGCVFICLKLKDGLWVSRNMQRRSMKVELIFHSFSIRVSVRRTSVQMKKWAPICRITDEISNGKNYFTNGSKLEKIIEKVSWAGNMTPLSSPCVVLLHSVARAGLTEPVPRKKSPGTYVDLPSPNSKLLRWLKECKFLSCTTLLSQISHFPLSELMYLVVVSPCQSPIYTLIIYPCLPNVMWHFLFNFAYSFILIW